MSVRVVFAAGLEECCDNMFHDKSVTCILPVQPHRLESKSCRSQERAVACTDPYMAYMAWLMLTWVLMLCPTSAFRSELESSEELPSELSTLTSGLKAASCRGQVEGLMVDLLRVCEQRRAHQCPDGLQKLFTKGAVVYWMDQTVKLQKDAVLWAGFWNGGQAGRTTKDDLFRFVRLMGMQTVHPDTGLGKLVEKNNDLTSCQDENIVNNFWKSASSAFIKQMAIKGQSKLLVLVNKAIDQTAFGLLNSVLYKYELPWVRFQHSQKSRNWHPQVLFVDMRANCHNLEKAVAVVLKTVPFECIECNEACGLDETLRARVQQNL
ncbi:unnamed protein product [Symbiodinium sp. CCMP2456]|nr:unnamed protein product [Symbiodinium sp. CCMP2456]